MVVGFLYSFIKYKLTFFSARCRFSLDLLDTGQAKAIINNDGLSKIKILMSKATIYRVMYIKCGKYEYKVY